MADVMTMTMPMTMEDITSKASSLNIDLSSIDWSSIRVPPGEHFGIISDDEDMYDEEELLEQGFGNVIVVDNIPVVSCETFDKLEGVLRMIFSRCGVIKENGLWIPVEEGTGRTRGYCFVEFNTAQEAELAKEKTDKYELGKKHVYVFAVNMFDDIEKFSRVPDEWAPPATTSYTPGVGILV
ncbi:hypothetical protein CTI12_AA512430 [Artemisia annua]|uniref:RRM domain-containing protein n=1 Tax=Artemisia annua TaxID=35608 RepID=A0A2U1LAQ1_ARTAN|nr:hypothetical protein CTI12_AA512430 [Artemisia annua]